MAFIDARLPLEVEVDAVRIDPDDSNVEIVLTDGNHEVRNARTDGSLLEFELAYPVSKKTGSNYIAVRDAYKVARTLHTFRFRDHSLYQLTNENIGTGDGAETAFQITKTTTFGASTHVRDITLPVAATLLVYKAGALQTLTTHYTVDLATGIITFVSAPTLGQAITVTCEFDVKVRFDGSFRITQMTGTLDKIETINLVERYA